MKKLKITNSKKAVLLGFISVLLIGFALISIPGLKAQFSFMDKLVKITGENLAERLHADISSQVGQIEETEEVEFGRTLPDAWQTQSGLTSWMMGGDFKQGSSTIVAFINPFGSPTSTDDAYNQRNWYGIKKNTTSTIDFGMLNITGSVSTTHAIKCGLATDAYANPTYSFLETNDAGSASAIASNTKPMIVNNGTSTNATNRVGQAIINGGNISKVYFTPDYSWFVCKTSVVNTLGEANFQSVTTTNPYAGKWNFEVIMNP